MENFNVIFQLNDSIKIWQSKYQNKLISYKLSIIDARRDFLNEIDAKNQRSYSKIKIAILNENDSKFKTQEQFGHIHNSNESNRELVFLKVSIDDPNIDKWAYIMEFYIKEHKEKDSYELIGYTYLIPFSLQDDNGTINSVIIGTNHILIGQLTADYLIIKPLKNYSNKLACPNSFEYYLPSEHPIHCGHRGLGKGRVQSALENTILSFNLAARHGADMVELDVQLSRDRVPVVYHDFSIAVHIVKKPDSPSSDFEIKKAVGVKDLTMPQLETWKSKSKFWKLTLFDFRDSDTKFNQPFPELEQVLKSVDEKCAINVEVKYPMKTIDDKWEGPVDSDISMNDFVDIILTTLIEHAKDRRIVLSTFHPDICILLQQKQNKFPVLYLTQGQTERYMPFKDPRAKSTHNAIYLAKIFDFYGVNVHAEDLFKKKELITYIKNFGLKLYSWGNDINSKSAIDTLVNEGVDGIIYDEINKYRSPKEDPKE